MISCQRERMQVSIFLLWYRNNMYCRSIVSLQHIKVKSVCGYIQQPSTYIHVYVIRIFSCIASHNQMRLDDLLRSIDVSITDNQPKMDWRKRMDTRDENWETFRSKLFEEVVMYSSMPADSVSHDRVHLCKGIFFFPYT